MKSARRERDLCKPRLLSVRAAKGAENGAYGSPAKQFQNLPGMTEPCRTRVDGYTDSPPVRKLWGGILPRSDTSAFPRDASGGFTRCCYLSHCVGRGWELGIGVFVGICRIMSVEGESAALVFLSVSVAMCRTRVRVRLWNVCRYLSHCVGQGGECGFGMFVDICRIVSVERERGFGFFVGICRIMSVERERGFGVCVGICRILSDEGEERLCVCVDSCRILSVEGESAALAFLSVFVALCR